MEEMYQCRFWTKDLKRTGVQIMACSSLDAKLLVQDMYKDTFSAWIEEPKKV